MIGMITLRSGRGLWRSWLANFIVFDAYKKHKIRLTKPLIECNIPVNESVGILCLIMN